MKLGPKEAAARIRDKFTSTQMHPADQHAANYLGEVLGHMSLEKTPQNMQRLFDLLREEDIEVHRGHQFPKYLGRVGDRDVIADDEEHEEKLLEEFPALVPAEVAHEELKKENEE